VGFNHPLPGKIQQQQAGGPRLETTVERFPKKVMIFFIPPKTTPLKINIEHNSLEVWKIIFLSKLVIYRFHVNLPGCNGCGDSKGGRFFGEFLVDSRIN